MSPRTDAQLLLDQLAYFRARIEVKVSAYEESVRRIDHRYTALVEKLAQQAKDDPTLAYFYRDTMRPEQITSQLRNIRWLLESGEIAEADRAFESLKGRLTLIEDRLRFPIFETGYKQRTWLEATRTKTNAGRKSKADRRHQEWRTEARKVWGRRPGFSVSRCAKCVIDNLKIKARPKTVEDAIRDLRP